MTVLEKSNAKLVPLKHNIGINPFAIKNTATQYPWDPAERFALRNNIYHVRMYSWANLKFHPMEWATKWTKIIRPNFRYFLPIVFPASSLYAIIWIICRENVRSTVASIPWNKSSLHP